MCRCKREYKDIEELLKARDVSSYEEDPKMLSLAKTVKTEIKEDGITKNTFIEIIRWKTGNRAVVVKTAKENGQNEITEAFDFVLTNQDTVTRIKRLDELKGVGVAVASAILTILDRLKYAVIDIRVWRVLCKYDQIEPGACTQYFTPKQYDSFLTILDSLAEKFQVTPRAIEGTLWQYDKDKSGCV